MTERLHFLSLCMWTCCFPAPTTENLSFSHCTFSATVKSVLLFSCSVMSNSLWLQHTRLPCPSPSPGVCSSMCPLSQWCHPTISSSVIPFSSCLQSLQYQVFSSESAVHIRWPMYWSFSFSVLPSNEYSGLTSFRIDWFDPLSVQETLKSLHQHHNSKVSVLCHSALFMVQLTSIHDYWKNHSFDYMDFCRQSNVSAF